MKMLPIGNSKTSDTNFGIRIKVGTDAGELPYAKFLTNFSKYPSRLSAMDVSEIHAAIIRHIRVLQDSLGPVDPTGANDVLHALLKNQPLGIPPSIAPEIRARNIDLDGDLRNRFISSGREMEDRHKNEIERLYASVSSTDPHSPDFIKRIIETNEFLSDGLKFEMNVESGELDKIANSNEAAIFVVEHKSVPYDVSMGFGFLSQLYKRYQELGKVSGIPLPKFVINRHITDGLPPHLLEVFNKTEAVPLYVSSYPTGEGGSDLLNSAMAGFANNQNHIMIYPDGRRAKYKQELTDRERFQYGIGKMVQGALKDKERVKVVSLGTDYKDGIGSLHIGSPMYFSKDGNFINVSKGNIAPDSAAALGNSFYNRLSGLSDEEMMTITHAGHPIDISDKQSAKFMPRVIAGILRTDLDACTGKAKSALALNPQELQA